MENKGIGIFGILALSVGGYLIYKKLKNTDDKSSSSGSSMSFIPIGSSESAGGVSTLTGEGQGSSGGSSFTTNIYESSMPTTKKENSINSTGSSYSPTGYDKLGQGMSIYIPPTTTTKKASIIQTAVNAGDIVGTSRYTSPRTSTIVKTIGGIFSRIF